MAGSLDISLRPILATDNAAVAQLIRDVMPEFGAGGPGFAIHDPEVDDMYAAYSQPGAYYLVIEQGNQIIGGGGIGPLAGGARNTCELKKMYFYAQARGLGLGRQMLETLLGKARELGYQYCYLETLERMVGANHLYRKLGFKEIDAPLGATGHFGCDCWYTKCLSHALK